MTVTQRKMLERLRCLTRNDPDFHANSADAQVLKAGLREAQRRLRKQGCKLPADVRAAAERLGIRL